jgi:hypothetical protein
MADSYTEVTKRNWFQRFGDSVGGVFVGIALIIGACVLLFWNDGRAVEAERALKAGAKAVVSLASPTPQPANEGALVHLTGPVIATAPVTDPATGLGFAGVLGVARTVEMYQWVETSRSETREKLGGGSETVTRYSYERRWAEGRADSASFRVPSGHENPALPFDSGAAYATDARLGGFRADEPILSSLPKASAAAPSAPDGWRMDGGALYRGAGSPGAPQIGDVRVTFSTVASGTTASVVARQTGDGLTPWVNEGSSYRLLIVRPGALAADAMIEGRMQEEETLTWILRAVGTLLNILGFGLILGPLKALANIIPPVAWLVGAASGVAAFALGLPLSLMVIALAWFTFRPILSLGLAAAAIAAFAAFRAMGRRGAAPAGAQKIA